ncbi:FBP domain-containing protein [Actinomadura macra]|uniref:FBP domain-containing protein n=1 Tax=Actinomadura macra TaxID=46164 RepID=UPI000A03175B
MRAITERDLRPCFGQLRQGRRQASQPPQALRIVTLDEPDCLGWRDPKAPDRAYLVAETGDRLTGNALRLASAPGKARGFNSTVLSPALDGARGVRPTRASATLSGRFPTPRTRRAVS